MPRSRTIILIHFRIYGRYSVFHYILQYIFGYVLQLDWCGANVVVALQPRFTRAWASESS